MRGSVAVAVAMSVAETVAVADTIAVVVGFIGFGATIRTHQEIPGKTFSFNKT